MNFSMAKSLVSRLFGKNSPYNQVIQLAYPVILSMLAITLMGVTDTIFMGWVSTAAQGGVGLGGILSWACASFFVGTLTVINTFVAQLYGANEHDRCGSIAWHGMLIVLFFTIIIESLASHIPRLVAVFGTPEEVALIASRYAFIRLVGTPLHLIETCITSFMRGIGDTRTPMKVALSMVLVNIPLNYWLIFGGLGLPPLGPAGAAYATVITAGIGVFILIFLFCRREMRVRFNTQIPNQWSRTTLTSMLKIGVPIGVGWVLEMATWAIFTAFISKLGKEALAAHNIVLQVIHVSFMPGVAFSVAATTLVGQGIGAQDWDSAERHGSAALKIAMFYMLLMGLIFLGFGKIIATGFNRDPVVVHIASQIFILAAAFQAFDAMGMVCGGILRGAGDTRFPMIISITYSWLVFLPLVWLLGFFFHWGALGSWFGATVYIVGVGVTLFRRVRTGKWKTYSVASA